MANQINIGSLNVSAFKVGSDDCSIYLGTVKLYPVGFHGKFKANYTNSKTFSAACNSSSVLASGETRPSWSYQISAMTDVEIGDCVTEIGHVAFSGATNLTSVTIPDNVTTIGANVFVGCNSLPSITIPDSVTTISGSAFNSCASLTSVTLSNSLTAINSSTFYYCHHLPSITIPDSVTTIGNYAFYSCSGLTNVEIGSGVTSIGGNAFYGCSGLTGITVRATTPPTLGTSAFKYTNNAPIYVPCNSVEAYKTAWSTYAIRIQAIPNTCVFSGKFKATYTGGTSYSADCDGSSTLTSGETNPSGYKTSAMTDAEIGSCVTSIGDRAFAYYKALSSVTIPDSVTSIGSYAFNYCSALSSVTIPSGVTFISNYLFMDSRALTGLTISSAVTGIGISSFANCYGITSIDIPDSVTSISNSAFEYCSGMTSVTIGSGVTSIETGAFTDCKSLTSITITATVPPALGNSVFNNTNNAQIYVPAGSVEDYKAAAKWSSYSSRIQAIPT